MSEHEPPLVALPSEDARPGTWEVQQDDSPWERIAHVYGETEEEAERRARLIAAAPELLAACKIWDEGFVDGEEFTDEQFLKWVNDNRRVARAAIAKATGTETAR
jgi:hypothetical protein